MFFSSKSSTISMILFRKVSLSRGKSTTRFWWSAFFRRKVAIFIGRETKTHFTDENQRKKIAKVSTSDNNFSFRIIHQSTTIPSYLERLRFIRRGASTPLWGVESCSFSGRWPYPILAIPPYVVMTPHLHGAPTMQETSTVKL